MVPPDGPGQVRAVRLLVTYLRARRVPQRMLAVTVVTAAGTALASLPAPAVRIDLDAAPYPAVLVGALAPVLVGVVCAAPAPTRLRWVTEVADPRAYLLALVELTIVLAAASAAAALCGFRADLSAAAVQNALITFLLVVTVSLALGAAAGSAAVGATAVAVLLVSPGLPPAWWVLVDTLPDGMDWWALVVLAPCAVAAWLRTGRHVSRGRSAPPAGTP